MPMYRISCACGNQETLDQVRAEPVAKCDECGEMTPRQQVYKAAFRGDFGTAGSEVRNDQLGMTFHSRSAMEAYMEEKGLYMASDSESRQVKDEAREKADSLAKREGFRDARDRKARMPGQLRDRVAANREAKAEAYAQEHGSGGRQSADDAGWGEALPIAQ